MYVLILEDDAFKYHAVSQALKNSGAGKMEIESVDNLEEGLELIKKQFEASRPYELIVTDMYYPNRSFGEMGKSGEQLIEFSKEQGWSIPIILCSSVSYQYPGIFGTVHYSENENWEWKMAEMVRKLK